MKHALLPLIWKKKGRRTAPSFRQTFLSFIVACRVPWHYCRHSGVHSWCLSQLRCKLARFVNFRAYMSGRVTFPPPHPLRVPPWATGIGLATPLFILVVIQSRLRIPHMDGHEINLLEFLDLTPDDIHMLRLRVRRTFSWYPISLTYATPVRVSQVLQLCRPELFQFQDQLLQDNVPPPPQPQLEPHMYQQVHLCRLICCHS